MLLKDDNLRVKLGRQARERIVEHFSIEHIAEKYENIYNKHFID